MIWACFLHFYQPPTQKRYWVDRITDESYRRLVQGLLLEPRAKITLNINSILCELWETYGHTDVLQGIRKLVERGQVELTGSAKFHPLLPKLPKEQVIRQIKLNEISLNKYFGVVGPLLKSGKWKMENGKLNSQLRGFFPPEMAYDRNLAGIVADLGYEWVIAEELSLEKKVEYDRIYEVSGVTSHLQKESPYKGDSLGNPGLKIFFRDRGFSYKLLAGYLGTEKLFLDEVYRRFPTNPEKEYLLTAMDGETFGHHRPGLEQLLFDLFKIPQVEMTQISHLPELFKIRESVQTRPSTWALMEHEVEKNLPFARWDDPENEVHKLQWKLTSLAINSVENSKHQAPKFKQISSIKHQRSNKDAILNFEGLNLFEIWNLGFGISDLSGLNDPNLPEDQISYVKAQLLLDRALHSDQYWWASAKPWWSIEYVERGAKELLEAVKACGQPEALDKAQKLYYQILETAFQYQRSGKVDEISSKEDETIRMRTDQAVPKMPKEELLKIIGTIKKEMWAVAQGQEYERAAQLRDRIKELEGYLNV